MVALYVHISIGAKFKLFYSCEQIRRYTKHYESLNSKYQHIIIKYVTDVIFTQSFRLSKSLADPNAESKTATSDEHKHSPHTIGTPHPLASSLSTPNIKGIESSSGSRSGNHSRHSSKDDSSNTNSVS